MPERVLIPFRHAKRVKPYVDAANAAGLDAVPADVGRPLRIDGFSGLLLMGGSDVNPRHYHSPVDPMTETPDDERDLVELELIGQALAKDLPILAICRGLQILNVFHGGTLIQHLPNTAHHDPEDLDTSAPAHQVVVEPGTLLYNIAGGESLEVNSRHHQAAGRIGAGLEVSALDPVDGTVEGLERRDRPFVVAVQWHPEDQVRRFPQQLRLFTSFAAAL